MHSLQYMRSFTYLHVEQATRLSLNYPCAVLMNNSLSARSSGTGARLNILLHSIRRSVNSGVVFMRRFTDHDNIAAGPIVAEPQTAMAMADAACSRRCHRSTYNSDRHCRYQRRGRVLCAAKVIAALPIAADYITATPTASNGIAAGPRAAKP